MANSHWIKNPNIVPVTCRWDSVPPSGSNRCDVLSVIGQKPKHCANGLLLRNAAQKTTPTPSNGLLSTPAIGSRLRFSPRGPGDTPSGRKLQPT